MNYVKNLKEVYSTHAKCVGVKAANLGQLILNGIAVPSGFVITSNVYHIFIKENNIKEDDFWGDTCDKSLIRKTIIEAIMPQKIKDEIISAYIALTTVSASESIAIRSSAIAEDLKTASFAGQMDTYLNICGEENLILAVKKIYASLYNDGVSNYRTRKGVFEENGIAIIVQSMIKCDASGVLFTVNPISQNRAEVMINAAYGLGETVVSGITSPDEYICDKSGNLICSMLGNKERKITYIDDEIVEMPVPMYDQKKFVLDDLLIKKLIDISLQIERLFKTPMDIEWGLKDGTFFILQARPITTTF